MVNRFAAFLSVAVPLFFLAACDKPSQDSAAAPAADASTSGNQTLPYSAQAEAAAKTITGPMLSQYIKEISDDRFEGRGPASDGDVAARAWIAEQLAKAGFKPAGNDGGWEQPFDLVGITSEVPKDWVFGNDNGELILKNFDQFIAGSGVQNNVSKIDDAEVVFVGYGIEAPEYEWNDYKGEDLRGKVLLMLNNDPDWDPDLFHGDTRLYYGRWRYKYESAARQGAAGAIIIHTRPSAGYPFQVVQTSWTGEQFQLPAENEPRVQVEAWLTEDAAKELVSFAGLDLDALVESARSQDFQPMSLGVTTSLELKNKISRVETANVLGLLPGSDPELSSEVVIYSAHHDHLGIGQPNADGDKIYNGALDNGTGIAQLLAISNAFSVLPEPPKRSILMAFVGAEEQGLLGSQYYATHPTFPPGKIAANINYDGGNIVGKVRDLTFIGYGKSTLDGIVDSIAASQNRVVNPDQFPDRGYFYRSDQFNFAKVGVPAFYMDAGIDVIGKPEGWGAKQVELYEEQNYHQPSDEFDESWNYEGMIDDAQLGFWVGDIVGNAGEMQSWVPGDEFEAARLEALKSVKQAVP